MWDTPLPLKEELRPVAPFRAEMLPEALRPWILDNAERMQAPIDFFAAAAVVLLGSLVGRKVGISPKANDDWLVIPNLWGAIVGRPSLLKTPAISEMMKPLEKLVGEAITSHREKLLEYEEHQQWIEAQKSAHKENLKKAARQSSNSLKMPLATKIESIPKPILKRYKTEDATVEKIGEILQENPQGILIHRDELVGWLKSLDKYGREGDRAFFLESWDGKSPYTVDRIARGTLHVPALCLSIIGGIQPGPLANYVHQAAMGGGGDDGLLQRFQVLVWPDAQKPWKNVDRPPNNQAKEEAYEVFRKIEAFAPFEPSSEIDLKTHSLHFDSIAQPLFDQWWCSLEGKIRQKDISPSLESHLGKYRSLMPSLALIFYLVETVGKGKTPIGVDAEATQQAIQWCDYLETHARRLYASGEDPSMESARALLDRIQRGDLPAEFSPRDVYYAKHWAKLDTAEQVKNGLQILEDFGWVRVEEIKTNGRPLTRVKVHPQLRVKGATS